MDFINWWACILRELFMFDAKFSQLDLIFIFMFYPRKIVYLLSKGKEESDEAKN